MKNNPAKRRRFYNLNVLAAISEIDYEDKMLNLGDRVRFQPRPNPALSLMPEIAIFAMLAREQAANDGIDQRVDPESAVPPKRSS
jgi:hypothetical protein